MENMKAVRVHNCGGPEVLRFEDAPRPTPDSGEWLTTGSTLRWSQDFDHAAVGTIVPCFVGRELHHGGLNG